MLNPDGTVNTSTPSIPAPDPGEPAPYRYRNHITPLTPISLPGANLLGLAHIRGEFPDETVFWRAFDGYEFYLKQDFGEATSWNWIVLQGRDPIEFGDAATITEAEAALAEIALPILLAGGENVGADGVNDGSRSNTPTFAKATVAKAARFVLFRLVVEAQSQLRRLERALSGPAKK